MLAVPLLPRACEPRVSLGSSNQPFSLGVEEEYQIVDPHTRALRARASRILRGARPALGEEVQPELHLSQIETASPVCASLAEVRAEVTRLRRELIEAAECEDSRIVAAGTHPFSRPEDQPITPKARYRKIHADYQALARDLVIFGCHVHVGIDDPEAAVQVLNRARVWLAPLLALSANSPFWQGEDTGYASFRTELWSQWPTAGQPGLFSSRAEYEELLQALVACGALEDATKIYWDIRLPQRIPTIEFRVTDVCATVDEAVMIAGLVRALVWSCYEEARRDTPYCGGRPELIRAAHWRAARYGLSAELVDVRGQRTVPARELVNELMESVRPGLEWAGDWDEVSALVRETLARGTGAARQREVYERYGRLEDVVDFLVAETRRDLAGEA